MCNSFSRRLGAIWLTYLPWRSPLGEEAQLLPNPNELPAEASAASRAFVGGRRAFLATAGWEARLRAWEPPQVDGDPPVHDPRAALWGAVDVTDRTRNQERVRNRSVFGFQLNMTTALAAIGAAVHAQRTGVRPNDPRRRLFDMPSVVRSYYDAVIVASILRWLEPGETWWGDTDEQACQVVDELIVKTVDQQEQQILVPELLLAAAMGKLPRAAAERAYEIGSDLIAQWEEPERVAANAARAVYDAVSGRSGAPLSFRLPANKRARVERVAEAERKTVSQLAQDALDRYIAGSPEP